MLTFVVELESFVHIEFCLLFHCLQVLLLSVHISFCVSLQTIARLEIGLPSSTCVHARMRIEAPDANYSKKGPS